MLTLNAFRRTALVHSDARFRVDRGIDLRDGAAVRLKTTASGTPDPRALAHLHAEHANLCQLRGRQGIPTPRAFFPAGASMVLVVDDFDGIPLDALLGAAGPLPLARFFEIALALLEVVQGVHQAGLIHHKLRPRDILVNDRGLQLQDFGDSSRFSRETVEPVGIDRLEGMLAYMAPEQTGRMNRSVDYRSDYYALGAIFHEMLTGRPPFDASDALAYVHCHLARHPVPPIERRPDIPRPLSDLVLKLLAKLAEDRYESGTGLEADLRRCQREWVASGTVAPFALGSADVSDRFQLTERLYGREAELAALLAAFERVATSGRPELMLVAGYAGVGKSRLIGELHKPIASRRGFFLEGKLDPNRRDLPHAALSDALQTLVQQLLAGTALELAQWRQRIVLALGDNSQAMVELVPQLQLVIGTQPPLRELPPELAQQRLHRCLRQFVSVFARTEHPLVLFLDDLQWADGASVDMLAQLVGHPETTCLLVIGAYRDNEVDAGHPLARLQTLLAPRSVPATLLTLAPLDREHLTQLLADTLRCSLERAAEPARIVHAKTRGNPFFVFQFISALHKQGLISFDPVQGGWVWQLEEMAARNFTDNAVELMLTELRHLPAETHEALAVGGLLGQRFTVATLDLAGGPALADAEAALRPAVEVGLLSRGASDYRFMHDRVRQAASALTPASQRAARHWHIGCSLLDGLSADELDERALEVADHLNQGLDCAAAVADAAHRIAGARLNLRAATKAQFATAYAAAGRYLCAGAVLLEGARGRRDPSLAFALRLGRAKNACLAGEFEAAETLLDEVMREAPDDLAWAEAAQVAISLKVSQRDVAGACRLALACLARLGIELPARPDRAQVLAAYAEHQALLDTKAIETLADLPRMTDPRQIAATRVLVSIHSLTFFVDRDLWALSLCTLLILTQRHGLSDAAPRGVAVFGFAVSTYIGDQPSAMRYGELALRLVRQIGSSHDLPMVHYHRALIGSWSRPLREVLSLEHQALQGFVELGDHVIASICAHRVLMDALMLGDPLPPLAQLADDHLVMARQANYAHGVGTLLIRRQQIASLRGETHRLGAFDSEDFDATAFLAATKSEPTGSPVMQCWYHLARLMVLCIAGEHGAGFAAAREAEPFYPAVASLLSIHDYHCYDALCIAALIDGSEGDAREALRARLRGHEARMAEHAQRIPATCGHSALLVAAEAARVDGEPLRAMALYEEAIGAARHQGSLSFEALANERAAHFYRVAGVHPVADNYLASARAAYSRWGADAKVQQIDVAHPRLAAHVAQPTGADRIAPVDALAIVKAAQAISGPMLPGALMREMLNILLQQGGAQFGALFLVREDTLELVASARGDGPQVEVALHGPEHPDPAPSWVPEGIASFVWRSGERVRLDDASAPHRFSGDRSLLASQARSVLAVPMLRQGGVVGVLYLAHRAVTRAFSLGHAAVVEQLAALAAISLESSRLYEQLAEQQRTLQARVEARTLDLERSGATMQTMLDAMPALVALKGLDGRYIMHNRRYAEQLGHGTQSSLVGLLPAEVGGMDFAERARRQDLQVIESGKNLIVDQEENLSDGPRTLQVHKFPVRDSAGAIHAVGSIAIDVTDFKKAQVDAEAAVRAKSHFLANMSHEIRTPMNAILGMAHLALGSGLNPQQHNYVQKLQHSAQALLGLINDILDFSKIEAGKLELEPAPFRLSEVLNHLDSVIGLAAAAKNLEFVFDCAPEVPDALVGDPLRLGQVLINLANNAVKFTERGEVVLRIDRVASDATGVVLRFQLRDSGVGMSREQRSRLFSPFTQADSSTSRRFGGTGLGLTISSELVHLLGGEIEVESDPGQGSTFRFTARLGLQAEAGPIAPPAGAGPRRVLLVDDNAASRAALARLCVYQGWRVEEAADGWDALRCVALSPDDPFDLIVLDWRMPGMDGAECAQRLGRGRQAPMVMLTSTFDRGALDLRLDALGASVDAVLSKPVLPTVFLETCASVIEGRPVDEPVAPPSDAREPTPPSLHGVHVLLVEDNLINQELAVELLSEAGMRVSVAGHGGEAIDLLERETFDMVLMDCQMPVLDGYEATRLIRQRPQWTELPIIALTANATASDRRKALASGMNDHIAKPIDVSAMFETLAQWANPGRVRPASTPAAPANKNGTLALPGIDVASGLACTDGNEKLYRRLLLRFRDAQRDFTGEFRRARARGDLETANRLAHDLRAVAGTLGAKSVEAETRALELACREENAGEDQIASLLRRVSEALDTVMQGLETL